MKKLTLLQMQNATYAGREVANVLASPKAYTLHKQPSGKAHFIYTVKDQSGNTISTRRTKNDYVACTKGGSSFFGRVDLVGKGEHGRLLNLASKRPDLFTPGQLEDINTIVYL